MISWLVGAAVVLVAGTVWLLARSVTRAPQASAEQYRQLTAVRDRLVAQLNELDVENADHNVDAETVADERRRLEAELAQVLRELETVTPAAAGEAPVPRRTRLALIAGLALLLPLVGGGLYVLKHQAVLTVLTGLTPAEGDVPPAVMEMVARLENRLKEQPDDAQGWARLGRAYAVLGRPDEAQAAYRRAQRLAPKDIEILGDYGAFLLGQGPREPSPEAVAVFEQVVRLDPKHAGALWVLGLNAFTHGRYAEAQRRWEHLLVVLPADAEVAPQVRQVIEEAKARQKR